MIITETLAVLFTLISVYLTIKSNILCWLFGIIGIILYLFIFFKSNLYMQSALQIIFLIQSIFGWYYWDLNKEEIYKFISGRALVIDIIVSIILISISTFFISKNNKNVDPQPLLDSITTVLSILATWYMARKVIYHWIIWIIVDIFSIILFLSQHLYYSVGLYILLMFMCVNGMISWVRKK